MGRYCHEVENSSEHAYPLFKPVLRSDRKMTETYKETTCPVGSEYTVIVPEKGVKPNKKGYDTKLHLMTSFQF